jgi:hypothetical protein
MKPEQGRRAAYLLLRVLTCTASFLPLLQQVTETDVSLLISALPALSPGDRAAAAAHFRAAAAAPSDAEAFHPSLLEDSGAENKFSEDMYGLLTYARGTDR